MRDRKIVSQACFWLRLGVREPPSYTQENELTHPKRTSSSAKDKDVQIEQNSQIGMTLMDDDNDALVWTTDLSPGRKMGEANLIVALVPGSRMTRDILETSGREGNLDFRI